MLTTTRPQFPHHKLDGYRVATELARAARALASQLGHSDKRLADQLHRASTAVPLLVAEGVNRRTPGQKRQRFTEARGEAAETASASELAAAFGLVDSDEGKGRRGPRRSRRRHIDSPHPAIQLATKAAGDSVAGGIFFAVLIARFTTPGFALRHGRAVARPNHRAPCVDCDGTRWGSDYVPDSGFPESTVFSGASSLDEPP